LVSILQQKLAEDEVTFNGGAAKGRTGIQGFGLNQFGRRYIYHLLARVSRGNRAGCWRVPSRSAKLVNRELKPILTSGTIWADDFEAVKALFASEAEFASGATTSRRCYCCQPT